MEKSGTQQEIRIRLKKAFSPESRFIATAIVIPVLLVLVFLIIAVVGAIFQLLLIFMALSLLVCIPLLIFLFVRKAPFNPGDEFIILNKSGMTFTREFHNSSQKTEFSWDKINSIRFVFPDERKEPSPSLHRDFVNGNIEVQYEGGKFRFGDELHFWDFEELLEIILSKFGKDFHEDFKEFDENQPEVSEFSN